MPLLSRSLRSFAAFRAGAPALFRAFAANEGRDRRALEALQVERLKALLVHAGETVPFWRRRFARFGIDPALVRSIRDLAALPPLDDRDRRDFGRELLAGAAPERTWLEVQGLGAAPAAAPALWLEPTARRERQVDELRHVGWTGVDWRAPRAELIGRAETGAPLPVAGGALRAALRGGVWLHPHRIAEGGAAFASRAARAGARLLLGPPSALLAFEPAGFRPAAVQAFGECLGEERRAALETRFGAPVFDAWRTRELGEAAHECGERNGLHVSMERVLLEVVRDGRPVPDGEDGEILATALDGRAQPLLRWRTGDIGCLIPEKTCACGRTSERILLTEGRASELVTSPAGTRIHGDWLEWMFDGVPGVRDWRIAQARDASLAIELVTDAAWTGESEAKLRAALAGADAGFAADVRTVAALPPSPDGRRRAIVSAVPLAWEPAGAEPLLAGHRG